MNHDIIVIGGAAEPLGQILGRLPTSLPAAVFVVLHVPAQGIGILSTVVKAAGKLPIRQAEKGMVIENGHVYLAGRRWAIDCSPAGAGRSCQQGL